MTMARVVGWTLTLGGVTLLGVWMLLPHTADFEANAAATAVATRTIEAREFWSTYRDASAHRMAGDCSAAVSAYRAALALRPQHEDSLYYLGNCLLDLERYDEAIDAYRQLVALNPDGSARAYVQWGLVHASLHPGAPLDLQEAGRLFQRAADLEPDSGAHLGLAEIAVLRGDLARAEQLLIPIATESPMNVPAPYLLGYLAWRTGAVAEAKQHLAVAVERMTAGTPPSKWSEEGDVKAAPALRWRALARQSVFGSQWLALRSHALASTSAHMGASRHADLDDAYRSLDAAIAAARTRR